jgi:AraC-like DNA-binding protein
MEMDSLKEYSLEPGIDPVGANKYRLVEQARDYVENNLTENISMASVSGALGVSAQYLSRIFKEVMSVNFIDFLIDKKLEKARLLFDHDRSITVEQAATRIGYSNASYFIRKFKEKYGVTPNAYKSGLDPQPDAEGSLE